VTDRPEHRNGQLRSRFITWFLVGTGAVVAFLSLCQRQKTLEKLSEWEFHLRAAGKVLVLSDRGDLGTTRVEPLEIVFADEEPALLELARGTDEEAFARALRAGGYGGVVVKADLDAGQPPGPPSVQARLAGFRPGLHFHALMLRPGAGLYAPRAAPRVDDDVLDFLVGAARLRLAGATREASGARAPRGALAEHGPDGVEVALQIEGLKPKPVRTARANQIRQDLSATGVGLSLLDAVLDAADGIADRFERAHAAREGPLAGALKRFRIELHVLHSFTLIDHLGEDVDAETFRAFLDRVLDPGVTGLALGWRPPQKGRAIGRKGFRIRLPSDAIYWSRKGGVRMVERVLLDARLGKIEDLGKRPYVSLDVFRSIHVMEKEPGGGTMRMSRGIAAQPPREDPSALLARVAAKIASDMSAGGAFRQSYYPVRDQLRLGKAQDGAAEDAHLHGLGMEALNEAARALEDGALAQAADRALGRMMRWLRACSGAGLDPTETQPPELPPIGRDQVLTHCGPVDVTGRPVAVSGWRPGGQEETAVPDGLVFVVHGGTARLGTASLALLGLVEHIGRDPGSGRRARLGPLVQGLVGFILMMQREDGSFQSHFVINDHGLHAFDEPEDTGMALLALSRASSLIDDPRIGPALQRGFAAHAVFVEKVLSGTWRTPTACTRLAGYVPWVAFAASDARDLVPGHAAEAAASDGARLLASGCLITEAEALSHGLAGGHLGGGMPGARDVLSAAASVEALRLGPGGDGNERVHELALELGRHLALRLVVTPGVNDHFLPVPGKAAGGVGRDLVDHRQRLDSAFAVVALLSRLMR